MPATTTINAEQRRGLYELVRNHLGGIGDVTIALEVDHDIAAAERLGRRFAADLRLLDDLGWQPEEEREFFELTMPVDALSELLARLREEAELLLGSPSERRSRREDEEVDRRQQFGLDACRDLLAAFERKGGC